ncbi:hypothetical protein HC761_00435 [bacterium]|nr:hypothetical protein [bacterium]
MSVGPDIQSLFADFPPTSYLREYQIVPAEQIPQPYRDLLDTYIADLTSRFTVEELYHEGQQRHLAFTPVNDATAVAGAANR